MIFGSGGGASGEVTSNVVVGAKTVAKAMVAVYAMAQKSVRSTLRMVGAMEMFFTVIAGKYEGLTVKGGPK